MFEKSAYKFVPLLIGAFLDYLNVVVAIVVFPVLFVHSSHWIMLKPSFISTTTMFVGFILAIYYLGQFLGTPFFGNLSDRYGRKKILYITLSGIFFGFVVTAMAIDNRHILWLFIGRFLAGFFAANISIAQSSMADISDQETKAGKFSLIEVAVGIGVALGGFLGGKLTDPSFFRGLGFSTPFWILAILALGNLIVMSLVFEETLVKKRSVKVSLLTGFIHIGAVFRSQVLKKIFIVFVCYILGWTFYTQFFSIFLLKKFDYTSSEVGSIFIYAGILYVVSQLFIVAPLSRSVRPEKVLSVSLLLMSLSSLVLFLVDSTLVLYSLLLIYGVSLAITFPNLIAIISNQVDAKSQGEVIGMVWSLQGFMVVAGTFLGSFIVAIDYQLPITLGGVFFAFAWVLYIKWFMCEN